MLSKRMFSSFEHWILEKIYDAVGRPRIRLALADGPEVGPHDAVDGHDVPRVIIRDRRTLASLIIDTEVAFGEAYADGRIQVEGGLVNVVDGVFQATNRGERGWYPRLYSSWLKFTQRNSRHGSRDNVHHHYDIGNDFYKLWLDEQLVYTCAYFPTPDATLEEAQLAKMDHVCRKLQLRPGERVVEAGCGWGALALHMARYYGVKVKAFNISHEQIVYARWRAHKEGLSTQVEFVEDDYRNISDRFDAFMSVGMLEHVGVAHYAELSRAIQRAIGDTGRGLLHFIGRNRPQLLNAWIRKRIFPGGQPPSLREVMDIMEPGNFAVLDVENLRFHYARTLEHWLDRFEQSAHQVASEFDERFVRMWRLYLAGSMAAFRSGSMQLFQLVFAGPMCQAIPWTRAHLYQSQDEDQQPSIPAFG